MPELTDMQLHRAARVEDRLNESIRVKLTERGWRPRIIGYSGYGAPGWARVMGRVLVARPGADLSRAHLHRGWRSFVTIPVQQSRVLVEIGGASRVVLTDRGGYVDVRVECELEPG
jgi:phosphatidate phosphatase APP1